MSSDAEFDEDDLSDLEDRPIDCYTHQVVIEIILPATGQVMMTHDIEVVAARPLSNAELEARVRVQILPWLTTLSDSPKFKARTGGVTDYRIVGVGVFFGC